MVSARLVVRGDDLRFVDLGMHVAERLLRPILLAVTELPAAEARLRVPPLLPPADQPARPLQGAGVVAQDGRHHAAMHKRRRHVDEGQDAPLGRERHLDVRVERVVPPGRQIALEAPVTVVVQPRPVHDVGRPDRLHQPGRPLGVHAPHQSVVRPMALDLVDVGPVLADGPVALEVPGGVAAPVDEAVRRLEPLQDRARGLLGRLPIPRLARHARQAVQEAHQRLLAGEVREDPRLAVLQPEGRLQRLGMQAVDEQGRVVLAVAVPATIKHGVREPPDGGHVRPGLRCIRLRRLGHGAVGRDRRGQTRCQRDKPPHGLTDVLHGGLPPGRPCPTSILPVCRADTSATRRPPGYRACHFDRGPEGPERRNLAVRTKETARFLDSLRSLGMTVFRCPRSE